MADFTAVTSARVAAGACVRLTRQIIILCGAESWRVFPIIARGVRKARTSSPHASQNHSLTCRLC